MRSRFSLARAGAAVVGASATALMLTALPAHAEPATGDLNRHEAVAGHKVNLKGHQEEGQQEALATSLMSLELGDDSALQVYCVEIDEEADVERTMVERPWDAYPNPDSPFHNAQNRHKINWVLHNAYPVIGADELADAVSAHGATLHDGLSEKEAITATQAAIWHFSDDERLKQDNPTDSDKEAVDKDVWATYAYLTGDANTGISQQPTPALKIKPAQAEGVAGDRIGPFTIVTNGEITSLEETFPEGVTVTDAEGKPLTDDEVYDGAEFYLNIPADAAAGEASFTLTASTKVATGRLFVAENYEVDRAQSLIVASSEKTSVTDTAAVNWTAAPTETTSPTETTQPTTGTTAPPSTSESAPVAAPSTTETTPVAQPDTQNLAYTGASVLTPVLIGVGLLGVGALALILVRRRKQA